MARSSLFSQYKKILLSLLCIYLIAFAIYSTDRILARNSQEIRNIEHKHEGYGHKEVIYFNKIFVIIPYEPFNIRDFLTSAFLILTGICSFLTFIILRKVPFKVNHSSFWLLMAIGFIYLGLDELMLIHEFLGINLAVQIYKDYPLANIIDKDLHGLIILFYAILAFVVVIAKHSFFKKNKQALILIVVGLIFHGSAAVIDYFYQDLSTLRNIFGPFEFVLLRDEFFEMSAAALYFSSIVLYIYQTLAEIYDYSDGSYHIKSP